MASALVAADIISAIEFDRTGQHLATGDRGGRVVLFERVASPHAQVAVISCFHVAAADEKLPLRLLMSYFFFA